MTKSKFSTVIFYGVDKAVPGFQVQSYGSAQTAPKSEATWNSQPGLLPRLKINGCGLFLCVFETSKFGTFGDCTQSHFWSEVPMVCDFVDCTYVCDVLVPQILTHTHTLDVCGRPRDRLKSRDRSDSDGMPHRYRQGKDHADPAVPNTSPNQWNLIRLKCLPVSSSIEMHWLSAVFDSAGFQFEKDLAPKAETPHKHITKASFC